jgi:hypothetical protein
MRNSINRRHLEYWCLELAQTRRACLSEISVVPNLVILTTKYESLTYTYIYLSLFIYSAQTKSSRLWYHVVSYVDDHAASIIKVEVCGARNWLRNVGKLKEGTHSDPKKGVGKWRPNWTNGKDGKKHRSFQRRTTFSIIGVKLNYKKR